jgi:1,4-dihydroxy-2-naphthoyl-CoA hydrolase
MNEPAPPPPTPEFLNEVRARTILGALDIEIVEASGERVVLHMPVGPKVHQPYGFLHGGASVVLAETGASIGAWLAAGMEYETFGVEINANHLRPVREGLVRSESTPIRQGASIAVWDTRITDEQGRLVCVSRCTIAVRPAGVVKEPGAPRAQ